MLHLLSSLASWPKKFHLRELKFEWKVDQKIFRKSFSREATVLTTLTNIYNMGFQLSTGI